MDMYERLAINGHNYVELHGASKDKCISLCTTRPDVLCFSVVMFTFGPLECTLSTYGYLDVDQSCSSAEVDDAESHVDDSLVMVDNVCYVGFLEEEEQDFGQIAGTARRQLVVHSSDSGSQKEEAGNNGNADSEDEKIQVTELQITDATKSTCSTSVITTTTTDISLSRSTGVTETQTETSPKSIQSSTTSATTNKGTTTSTNEGKAGSGVTETQTETSPKSIQSSTTSATTNKGTTTSTNEGKAGSGQDNIIAIAAGGACGGVAVIAVVIVIAVCIRKRRRSVEEDAKDKTRRDRIPSRSTEMLIESGITEKEEIVIQDNVLYTSSSHVVPADYKVQDNNPVVEDVYTQVKKPADQHVVTDVYAKPNKVGKETCNTDVYAKVNKVKKTASDHPKDTSENIEDMYAKPQKNKQNQQNNTPWLD
ncbi:uncharacterized protein [Haliotis cracherodii]|uniref:uncharacterized protein n=1 Tax=Haliotis cracherodii TaxID=6455 RepID=UPI0039EA2B9C